MGEMDEYQSSIIIHRKKNAFKLPEKNLLFSCGRCWMTRTGWKKKKEPPKGKEEGWLLCIEYQYRRVRKNKPVGADGTDRRNNPKKKRCRRLI
jgi:hypothetical protein